MTSVQDHPAALGIPQHISVTKVGGASAPWPAGCGSAVTWPQPPWPSCAPRCWRTRSCSCATSSTRPTPTSGRSRPAARPADQAAPDGRRRRDGGAADRRRAGQGQQLAHGRDVRGPGAGDQRAARDHAAALRRHDRVGEYRRGLPAAAPGAAGAGGRPARGAHQPVRLRGGAAADRRGGREGSRSTGTNSATWSSRPSTRWSAVHPETGEPDAAARPFRPLVHRAAARPTSAELFGAAAAAHHPAGEHRALDLAGRGHRDLGQPGHPALRGGRLRRPAPAAAPGHRSPATSRSASTATPAWCARATPATTPS